MNNKIRFVDEPEGIRFRSLFTGQIFRYRNPLCEDNVYIKANWYNENKSMAVSLKSGLAYSVDESIIVIPLTPGTQISIMVGAGV